MTPAARLRPLALGLLCLGLGAAPVEGRVTDGRVGLAGVRVHPDRTPRVGPLAPPPVALTDAEGRFHLDLAAGDTVLVVEKDGWRRDLVPRGAWTAPIALSLEPGFHREAVTLVRVAFPDVPTRVSDATLRALLFSREPGVASAANYLYEVSKGALLLEEGSLTTLRHGALPGPPRDADVSALAAWVLGQLKGRAWGQGDRVNNRTGRPGPDGKPDHLWIITPGAPQSLTADLRDVKPISLLKPLPWNPRERWPLVVLPEESPLGNVVHEAFHAMGEHRVDDLYVDCDDPFTAGVWDLMDAGQYRGWDRSHPETGPWREDTGASPSHPTAWVRAALWYRGRYADTVRRVAVKGARWEGWIAPASRAPGADAQWVTLPDPRRRGRFLSLEVRRPWGFERGLVGGRTGPGREGLLVALIDPAQLTHGDPKGPVRVVDAHPGTPEPPKPRVPCRMWELDDAAFNLGPGENPKGQLGPFRWEVLETDALGRMRVRVERLKGR
jgi:hypothetical protein